MCCRSLSVPSIYLTDRALPFFKTCCAMLSRSVTFHLMKNLQPRPFESWTSETALCLTIPTNGTTGLGLGRRLTAYSANFKDRYPSYPSPYFPTNRLISSLALDTQKS